jgi:cysteine desulfurase
LAVIYLDNNATTRPADEVVAVMTEALRELWANPSSVHRAGQRVRQQVELAREEVCRLIGCEERELIFTSGGTESTNLAIRASLQGRGGRKVLVTDKLEHSATRETAESLAEHGTEVVWAELAGGLIDATWLSDLFSERVHEIGLVSIQWANNETGAIQPVEEIGVLCRENGVRFHCDGTQWVGKMECDVSRMPFDLMSFSAHKFHGPKGVGGLFVKRGVRLNAEITGGPQERQRRGGTENVPGIIGMGVAAKLARGWLGHDDGFHDSPSVSEGGGQGVGMRMANARSTHPSAPSLKGRGSVATRAALRDRFEQTICARIPDAIINARDLPRLWNTSNIAFPRLEAEAILLLLSERGVYASAGAACSSGSLDPSPVLLAMGIPPELAHGSIRFSLSRETTDHEIAQALDIIPAVIERLRASMAAVRSTSREW